MRVAVLGGGRSSEHEVSLASAASVREGLEAAGHEVVSVELARDGRWCVEGAALPLAPGGGLLGVDVVFPALHGPFGEDGIVQGLLECLDVPYVGSDVPACALCIDKVRFKTVMGAAGVAQVAYEGVAAPVWRRAPDAVLERLAGLGLPVFVKPARLGSSVGIAKVHRTGGLAAALEGAFEHDPLAIVEAASSGVEVEISVLGDASPRASQPGEIVIGAEFYDFAAKYEPGGMQLIVPARIGARAAAELERLALEAFTRAGASGLARIDFFVEGDRVLLNELNTMPGFTATSVYAKLWQASGIAYPSLVEELCELARERHARARSYRY
jgi:D-alanine-D-alanine ligase